VGTAGVDTIDGKNSADILAGGGDADTLTGGNGPDDFYYAATSEGGDTVTDFASANDEFLFLSSAFGDLAAGADAKNGILDSANFTSKAEAYSGSNGDSTAATNGTAGFFFDSTNKILTYDPDGNGGTSSGFTIATTTGADVAVGDIRIVENSPV